MLPHAAGEKFDGKSARLVSSSLTCLKSWSLPTARARATAGRASTVANSRLRLGNAPSGSASPLQHARRTVEPAPGRDVGDGVAVADDEIASFQMIVQHLVVPLGLTAIAVERVVEALGRRELEMHGLAGKRPEARGDEQQPGEQLRPVRLARPGTCPSFRRDRSGWRWNRTPAPPCRPGPSVSTIAGTLPLGLMARKAGVCCSPLLVSTGIGLVGEAGLFKEERNLRGIGSRMEIESDHGVSLR